MVKRMTSDSRNCMVRKDLASGQTHVVPAYRHLVEHNHANYNALQNHQGHGDKRVR